ncbi:unnamed protein product [Strongylus vulgaris]|uniref:glucuronosyltransferase n=1 Tax=Strongylus vulgaris TaxID=40348 RepID=A0A3P7LBC8_STRVU|nr:unnamed protein product [Strongylus vulgaris]
MKKHYPGIETAFDIERNASINFVNNPPIFDFARPYMPRVNFVGGLHCHNATDLGGALNDFVKAANDNEGFVLITSGFTAQWDKAPKWVKVSGIFRQNLLPWYNFKLFRMFSWALSEHCLRCDSFGSTMVTQYLNYRQMCSCSLGYLNRIFWVIATSDAPTVLFIPIFLGQGKKALSGHPKCRAHISHGGINSVIESVWHGVPTIGIPLTVAGYDNLLRISARKAGLLIPKTELTQDKLIWALNEIRKKTYKEEMLVFQDMLRDVPYTELTHAAFWVEFIERHQEVCEINNVITMP